MDLMPNLPWESSFHCLVEGIAVIGHYLIDYPNFVEIGFESRTELSVRLHLIDSVWGDDSGFIS